jgi:hypothetical protein
VKHSKWACLPRSDIFDDGAYVVVIGPNGKSSDASMHGKNTDCEIGDYICLLSCIHVHPPLFPETITNCYQVLEEHSRPTARSQGCSDFAGVPRPHRVRTSLATCANFAYALSRCHRFFGISGLYFSLQYLSLSDATALTFLVPILTGFSGAVFLKEPLSLSELLAGCTCLLYLL